MSPAASDYFERFRQSLEGLVRTLSQDGIDQRYLKFGGAGESPARKPTIPTDARSEFLANRAMGDWAERILSEAIRSRCVDWKAVQYGNTERIAAGHPDFKAHYTAVLEEVRLFGKRPDLLIFPAGEEVPADLSGLSREQTDPFVAKAIGAIEVRSSKFDALTYMRVRREQKAAGKKSAREAPSFTVKVEDLRIVYRWLERHPVPQIYCQVFFDSLFAINFLDIFRMVAEGANYSIEKPKKSQEKATIMIPITRGKQVGIATAPPSFAAEHKVTALGRHDVYVVPQGGGFETDAELLREMLLVG